MFEYFLAGVAVGIILSTAFIAWSMRYLRALTEFMLKEKIYALDKIITLLKAIKEIVPEEYKPIVEETIKFSITWRNINKQLLEVPLTKLPTKAKEVLEV